MASRNVKACASQERKYHLTRCLSGGQLDPFSTNTAALTVRRHASADSEAEAKEAEAKQCEGVCKPRSYAESRREKQRALEGCDSAVRIRVCECLSVRAVFVAIKPVPTASPRPGTYHHSRED